MKVFANSLVEGEPADMAADDVADLDECAVSGDCCSDSCGLKADTAANNEAISNEARYVGGIPKWAVDGVAVDDVADLKPGVSSSLDESAVSSDCGSDSCKLKIDTAVNNGARYVGGIAKP